MLIELLIRAFLCSPLWYSTSQSSCTSPKASDKADKAEMPVVSLEDIRKSAAREGQTQKSLSRFPQIRIMSKALKRHEHPERQLKNMLSINK